MFSPGSPKLVMHIAYSLSYFRKIYKNFLFSFSLRLFCFIFRFFLSPFLTIMDAPHYCCISWNLTSQSHPLSNRRFFCSVMQVFAPRSWTSTLQHRGVSEVHHPRIRCNLWRELFGFYLSLFNKPLIEDHSVLSWFHCARSDSEAPLMILVEVALYKLSITNTYNSGITRAMSRTGWLLYKVDKKMTELTENDKMNDICHQRRGVRCSIPTLNILCDAMFESARLINNNMTEKAFESIKD